MGVLLMVVAGTALGLSGGITPVWGLTFAALCLCIAFFARASRAGVSALWATIVFLAAAHAGLSLHSPSPRELHRLMDRAREQVLVRGLIVDDPVRLVAEGEQAPTWRMTVRVEAIDRLGEWQHARGRMDVRWRAPLGDDHRAPAYGQRWEWAGVVQVRERRDWAWAFLPPYRMQAESDWSRMVAADGGHWLKHWSYAGRHRAAERLAIGLADFPDHVGILRALLLGYRQQLPPAHQTLFAWTGTLHIFAISGLHVGLLAGLLILLMRALGVPRMHWMLWLAPLLIFYTVATGLRPSAIRACTMALAFSGALWFNHQPDAPSAWAFAALLILLAVPAQLTAPGFIFSFVIVAGLIRLYPLLAGPARASLAIDSYQLQAPGTPPSAGRVIGLWLTGLIAASVAAWLSSAPLTAQYFNLFSPIALVGNLLVIPAAFLVVLTALLSLIAGSVTSVGAEIFNHANRWILTGLIQAIEWLSDWPLAYRHVRSPGFSWLAVWYALLFLGALGFARRTRRWLSIGLILVAGIGGWMALQRQVDEVVLLPAGDGHAVLIRSGPARVLYGAGPAYRSDAVLRALRREGVNRIDTIILDHAGAGHAAGAEAILAALPVGSVWHTDFPSRSAPYDAVLAAADAQGIPRHLRAAGAWGEWPGGMAWEILHPEDAGQWSRAADAALVLRVSRGHHSVLLTGAGGHAVERALIERPVDPAATVWVIGHQGVPGTAQTEWLDRVRPQVVVLDVSRFNRYGYPDPAVAERLDQALSPQGWLRTDVAGPVRIQLQSGIQGGRQRDRWAVRSAWGDEVWGH